MICCNCGNDNLVDLLPDYDTIRGSRQYCPDCDRMTEYHEWFQVNGVSHEADIVLEDGGYVIRQWRFVDQFEGWLPDGNPSDPFGTLPEAVKALRNGIHEQRLLNGGW